MSPLYLIAEIHPNPSKLAQAKAAFADLIHHTKQEEGCILYDLIASEESAVWLMVEKWSSREAWEAHMRQDHVVYLNSISSDFTTEPTKLNFYEALELPVDKI